MDPRETKIRAFNEMNEADAIAEAAIEQMTLRGVAPTLSIISFLHYGVIRPSITLSRSEQKHILGYLETFLADSKAALGLSASQSFND